MIFRIPRSCALQAPRGPKMAPRRPKMAPRGLQGGPRWPMWAPRGPKLAPRGLQEGPRWPQEGSKRGPTEVPRGISEPTWLREPSRKLPGPSQTPPGSDFGTNLVPKADPRRPHCRQSRSNYCHASCFLLRCDVGTAAGFAAGRWIYIQLLKMCACAHLRLHILQGVRRPNHADNMWIPEC